MRKTGLFIPVRDGSLRILAAIQNYLAGDDQKYRNMADLRNTKASWLHFMTMQDLRINATGLG